MMVHSTIRSAAPAMNTPGCALADDCLSGQLLGCQTNRGAVEARQIRMMRRGDSLHRPGDRVCHLYVLRTGAFKRYALSEGGDEHVLGFYLPGDTMGMDALGCGLADTHLVSLATSRVCAVSVERLMGRARASTDRLMELLAGMHSETQRLRGQVQLDRRAADERLAVFLMAFSGRLSSRGQCARQFILPMSRRDLASFLGIASETMSRLFARFQALELIEAERKQIRLLDPERLSQMAGEAPVELPELCYA